MPFQPKSFINGPEHRIYKDSAGSRMRVCPDRLYSHIPRITKPRVEGGSRSMALDIGKGACMIGGRPLYDGHHRWLRRIDRRIHRSGSLGRGGPQIFPQHSSHVFLHNLQACPFCTTYSSRSSMVLSIRQTAVRCLWGSQEKVLPQG